MSKNTVQIQDKLRQWILSSSRAGQDIPAILKMMQEAGYAARQSRRIVANVLDRPAVALEIASDAPRGLRTQPPAMPHVSLDDRRIAVTCALEKPCVRVLANVLSDSECNGLVEEARPRLQRARTVDTDGSQKIDGKRTSSGMFFGPAESPLVATIEKRIAQLVGLPVEHGEDLQILHYQPGQQYEPHVDWFNPQQPGYAAVTARGGQRVASVIIYLNTPEAGGGTHFPHAGLTVTAERGSAVYFAYETGDQASLHAGLPVQSGEKWIATRWLRERPYR